MTRETTLRERLARSDYDLAADLYLYPTEEGGKIKPVTLGWGCPCTAELSLKEGWDGYPLVETEMMPGDRRRVRFVFLSGRDAAAALSVHDRFYLWEGRFIGEAQVVR